MKFIEGVAKRAEFVCGLRPIPEREALMPEPEIPSKYPDSMAVD